MDSFALGLIKAAEIIEDGRIDEFVKNKYSSFNKTEIGKKILSRNSTLEELASYAEQMGAPEVPASGRAEYLEGVINNVLFG